MSDRNYYVLCDNNCKFPAMTKEQILAAISQAVGTGEIKNVDAGFITTLKEQNGNAGLTFWVGTQAQYNAAEKVDGCFYIITDDTTLEDFEAAITGVSERVEAIEKEVAPKVANAPVIGKVLWRGTAAPGANADTFIHVPDIVNYNVILVDGRLYSRVIQNSTPVFMCTETAAYVSNINIYTFRLVLHGTNMDSVRVCNYNDNFASARVAVCTESKMTFSVVDNFSVSEIIGIC